MSPFQDVSNRICQTIFAVLNFTIFWTRLEMVSYLRQVNKEGKVNVSLLVGKSRVTPMKPVTIPRLEFTAAVLAVKLNCQVQKEIEIPIQRIMF